MKPFFIWVCAVAIFYLALRWINDWAWWVDGVIAVVAAFGVIVDPENW